MARRAPRVHRVDPRVGEEPPQGALRNPDSLPLGQQVREMRVVDPRVGAGGKRHQALALGVGGAVGRRPTGIAVLQAGRAFGRIGRQQAAHLTLGEAQRGGRLLGRDAPRQQVAEDGEAPLRLDTQSDGFPRIHATEGDKVTGRVARTDSLAVHRSST